MKSLNILVLTLFLILNTFTSVAEAKRVRTSSRHDDAKVWIQGVVTLSRFEDRHGKNEFSATRIQFPSFFTEAWADAASNCIIAGWAGTIGSNGRCQFPAEAKVETIPDKKIPCNPKIFGKINGKTVFIDQPSDSRWTKACAENLMGGEKGVTGAGIDSENIKKALTATGTAPVSDSDLNLLEDELIRRGMRLDAAARDVDAEVKELCAIADKTNRTNDKNDCKNFKLVTAPLLDRLTKRETEANEKAKKEAEEDAKCVIEDKEIERLKQIKDELEAKTKKDGEDKKEADRKADEDQAKLNGNGKIYDLDQASLDEFCKNEANDGLKISCKDRAFTLGLARELDARLTAAATFQGEEGAKNPQKLEVKLNGCSFTVAGDNSKAIKKITTVVSVSDGVAPKPYEVKKAKFLDLGYSVVAEKSNPDVTGDFFTNLKNSAAKDKREIIIYLVGTANQSCR